MDYGTNMDYARANAVGVSTSGSDMFAVIAIMLAVLLLLALAAYVIYSKKPAFQHGRHGCHS